MTEEELFLSKILSNPADNVTRLVYADWLEERGDDESLRKARFLRLDHELAAIPESDERQKSLQQEVKQQIPNLAISWMMVVARVPIENCAVEFEFQCPKQWNNLQATSDQKIRFCEACNKQVHYCETIAEGRMHAYVGECVAIDSRVVRKKGDLEVHFMTLGLPRMELPARPRNSSSRRRK